MNKVTLNGKPPKDRINLNEKAFITYFSKARDSNSGVSGVVYHKKTDSLFFTSNSSNYKGLYKIKYNVAEFDVEKQCDFPLSSLMQGIFIRKGDIYIKLDERIYLFDIEKKTFTQIASNLTDTFSYGYCFYDEEKDALLAFKDNGSVGVGEGGKTESYSFINKSITEISNVFPTAKVIWNGAPVLKDRKLYFIGTDDNKRGIIAIDIDNGNLTTIKDALPYPTYGVDYLKPFLWNDKIHIFGLNDNIANKYMYKESESISNWEPAALFTGDSYGAKVIAKNENEALILHFSTSKNSYEIKKAYVKE